MWHMHIRSSFDSDHDDQHVFFWLVTYYLKVFWVYLLPTIPFETTIASSPYSTKKPIATYSIYNNFWVIIERIIFFLLINTNFVNVFSPLAVADQMFISHWRLHSKQLQNQECQSIPGPTSMIFIGKRL